MSNLVRFVRPEDASGILEIYNPFIRDTPVTFEEVPLEAAAMESRIVDVTRQYPWIVSVGETGRVSGYAYATRHAVRAAYRWSVDVAIYLDPAYRRQGLGRRLYGTLLSLLRQQGFVNAFAAIALPNAASVGLHEAMGFAACGVFPAAGFKLGEWRDVGWWHYKIRLKDEPMAEPLAFSEIRNNTGYQRLLA